MRSILAALTLSTALPSLAHAEVPNVATDILPIQGLVARVMGDLGAPSGIIRPGASPHSYALRPSEAAALESADVVFWVGPELTPWLTDTIDALAHDAISVVLLKQDGTRHLLARDGDGFDAHDHAHGHEDENHDDHADHEDHDEHEGEDDHDDHGHEAGGLDPHAWLDPENGKAWLQAIADQLAIADPENAAVYQQNAKSGQDEIDQTVAQIEALLSGKQESAFFVFHDAFHYFEDRFDVEAAGAITLSDDEDPSPAHMLALRDLAVSQDIACVLSETRFPRGLVDAIAGDQDVRLVTVDPLGVEIELNKNHYSNLLLGLGQSVADCL